MNYSRTPEIKTTDLSQCQIGINFVSITAFIVFFDIDSSIATKYNSNMPLMLRVN